MLGLSGPSADKSCNLCMYSKKEQLERELEASKEFRLKYLDSEGSFIKVLEEYEKEISRNNGAALKCVREGSLTDAIERLDEAAPFSVRYMKRKLEDYEKAFETNRVNLQRMLNPKGSSEKMTLTKMKEHKSETGVSALVVSDRAWT